MNPEWRLFGRATADDKSAIVAFLVAFDALKALRRKSSVDIKVVWEGEEEASSAHLDGILKSHAAELVSDVWLIGDGPVHQSRTPTIYFGARGSMGLDATIYGPLRALGGSVSAEHGIGIEKRDYLSWSRSEEEIALMRLLKSTLDPNNILNPGKVL